MAKWNKILVNFHGGMLIFMAITLSGCATPFGGGYGANRQSKEEFARYVEDVFRLQNSMTSEVMMLTESENDLQNHVTLIKAEQHMHKICAPLDEYASRDSDGLSVGLLLSHNVEKSAVDCERAARQVESLLK
ncbi:hypothetical protein [Methylobacter sp. YRD-M1]|uniref:hypothetical protein n=1 Tax=Methylobacter sp. YRD-M1 TaxID=2911520 RepID=UPI00227B7AD2|nr:hypothetical protein [Methylobacter sp. YRD-M1]WAK02908.1 hypothetical protein LZ558_03735 [Methylobacter sp. YRD-M1]